MAKKGIKISVGNIFSWKVSEGEYIYGRVLFDVTNQYMKKNMNGNNYMSYFNKCYLIETFEGVYSSYNKVDIRKKAVKSSFVPKDFFEDFHCSIIDNVKVEVKDVSFPEVLSLSDSNYFFSVGELSLPIDLTDEEYDTIKVYPTFGSGYWEIVATLDLSNRADLIEDGDRMDNYFKYSDLRYSPEIRKQIYQSLNENINQSYYELAIKYGFDLARLY